MLNILGKQMIMMKSSFVLSCVRRLLVLLFYILRMFFYLLMINEIKRFAVINIVFVLFF